MKPIKREGSSIWFYLALSIGCHLVFLTLLPPSIPQVPAPKERIVQVRLHESSKGRPALDKPAAPDKAHQELPLARDLPKAPPREPVPRPALADVPREVQGGGKAEPQVQDRDQRPPGEGRAPVLKEDLAARPTGPPAPQIVRMEAVGTLPPAQGSRPQVDAAAPMGEDFPPGKAGDPPATEIAGSSWPDGAPSEDKVSCGALEEGPSLPVTCPPMKEAAIVQGLGPAEKALAEDEGRPILLEDIQPVPPGPAVPSPALAEDGPGPRSSTGRRAVQEDVIPGQPVGDKGLQLPDGAWVQAKAEPRVAKPAALPGSLPQLPRQVTGPAREPVDLIPARPPLGEPLPQADGFEEKPIPGGMGIVQRVEPVYPIGARKLGLEGAVKLSVRIDQEGRPLEVNLAESSGRWDFDSSAMEAVAKWRFAPGREWIEVVIEFKLTD